MMNIAGGNREKGRRDGGVPDMCNVGQSMLTADICAETAGRGVRYLLDYVSAREEKCAEDGKRRHSPDFKSP